MRARRALTHRNTFRDALTWLDIHGGAPELVEQWQALLADGQPIEPPEMTDESGSEQRPFKRRRRRRRRGFRPAP